ncbi:hypothetical protein BDR26DRAFT_608165 [Obelidium mucronatum]|nr:hypothetical protein BDR26DRAFT_608165 [Obelidium mucronatum]
MLDEGSIVILSLVVQTTYLIGYLLTATHISLASWNAIFFSQYMYYMIIHVCLAVSRKISFQTGTTVESSDSGGKSVKDSTRASIESKSHQTNNNSLNTSNLSSLYSAHSPNFKRITLAREISITDSNVTTEERTAARSKSRRDSLTTRESFKDRESRTRRASLCAELTDRREFIDIKKFEKMETRL